MFLSLKPVPSEHFLCLSFSKSAQIVKQVGKRKRTLDADAASTQGISKVYHREFPKVYHREFQKLLAKSTSINFKCTVNLERQGILYQSRLAGYLV